MERENAKEVGRIRVWEGAKKEGGREGERGARGDEEGVGRCL